jgi:Zn-dependent protease with chaperone function
MRTWHRAAAAAAVAIGLAGCATSTAPGVTGVTRSQLLLVSSAQINSQAAASYSQVTNLARNKGTLNVNAEMTARTRAVADRLIKEVSTFRTDVSGWHWEVNVLESEQLNAMCLPGGKIVVYSGLIRRLALSDDELAAVMGHEIAHALREHGREKVSQHLLAGSVVQAVANANTRNPRLAGDVASLGAQLFVLLPFSREMELEADVMGLELMARAGYDPSKASNVWRKMQVAGATGGVEFFQTHPSSDRRIAELDAAVAMVLPLYEKAGKPATGQAATAQADGASTSLVERSVSPRAAADSSVPTSSLSTAPTSMSSIVAASRVGEAGVAKLTPQHPGKDSYTAERFAKDAKCYSTTPASLVAKGPGFETYSIQCEKAEVLIVRCEFGNCRALKSP